jgi:hypothetical protein
MEAAPSHGDATEKIKIEAQIYINIDIDFFTSFSFKIS